VLVSVPHKDAEFKTHPMKFMEGRTLKGTFYGHFKPRTDIPGVVEKYLNKVNHIAISCILTSTIHIKKN